MEISEQTVYIPKLGEDMRRLCAQLYAAQPDLGEKVLRGVVEAPDSHLLMAYDNGVAVGTATVGIYRAPGGVRAYIEDVVVDEGCRGMGVGRALVVHAVAVARRAGATTLSLTSNPARVAANALYRSMGFTLYQTNYYKMEL